MIAILTRWVTELRDDLQRRHAADVAHIALVHRCGRLKRENARLRASVIPPAHRYWLERHTREELAWLGAELDEQVA